MGREGEERFDHGEGLHGSWSFAEIAERNRVLRPQRIRGPVGGSPRPNRRDAHIASAICAVGGGEDVGIYGETTIIAKRGRQRTGTESNLSRFRLVAVYTSRTEAIRLVYFQSTAVHDCPQSWLPEKSRVLCPAAGPPWHSLVSG